MSSSGAVWRVAPGVNGRAGYSRSSSKDIHKRVHADWTFSPLDLLLITSSSSPILNSSIPTPTQDGPGPFRRLQSATLTSTFASPSSRSRVF